MAAAILPFLLPLLSGTAGALANRGKTTTQESNKDYTANQSGTAYGFNRTSPFFDATAGALRDRLASFYTNRLAPGGPQQLADTITTTNLQNNNRGSDIAQRLAASTMAAHGLNYSPAMSKVLSDINTQRIMKGVDITNQRDLMVEQLLKDRLTEATKFFGMQPYGQEQTTNNQTFGQSTGTERGTGSSTDPGNPLGGMFSSLATMLAGLYGQGAFGNKPLSPTNPGSTKYLGN